MAGANSLMMFLLLMLLINNIGSAYDECRELSCGLYKPLIRFPFQLIKEPQDHCTNPKFCLYCTQTKNTMIHLSTTSGQIKFLVYDIDYHRHKMLITDPENCLPKKFLQLNNSSFLPYKLDPQSMTTKYFFNCSSVKKPHLRNYEQTLKESQDMITCPIYMFNAYDSVLQLDFISCTKMFEINASTTVQGKLSLSWPNPNCNKCKEKGMKCKWKNNGSNKDEIECFDCKKKVKTIHIPRSLIFAATGSILLGLVLISLFKIHLYFRKKEEDQVRVDNFLEDYRAQKPARFSYADIKRITSEFREKLGEGAHGTVFKGKLSTEILVAVKMLNSTQGEGKEFINEVGIMGKIHHINVVRLLGFCADGIHRALVYNLFPNGSLQSYIFQPDNKDHFLGWEKLQQIGVGIAKGIEYLHQDFGLAKLCSKNLSIVSMTAAKGTLGYMAPEVLSRNFGNVSLKSDIYSYGMLLLEMVGGRKNVDMSSAETFHVLYPEWIHNLLEGDVHIHVEDEGDAKIAKKLAIVGLWCIQWQPINRPSIKAVVQMLETGEDNQLTVPPNPFHSTTLARRTFQMEVIQE
ncbi:rust resistance kinase Lr10-like isoform X2 [Cicer arietinum]|uniref:Rust resistance kinase Lr10-like isoform X2 n=1 Tax=Cicer arietinum TaxID=3827 RepID=A0A1S3E5D2_CICAR|nr:rust resistance kinase Lr10-like isoform X2 [Cicer arietinum]